MQKASPVDARGWDRLLAGCVWKNAFASRLAPTGDGCGSWHWCPTTVHGGSEPAREGVGSVSWEVGMASSSERRPEPARSHRGWVWLMALVPHHRPWWERA